MQMGARGSGVPSWSAARCLTLNPAKPAWTPLAAGSSRTSSAQQYWQPHLLDEVFCYLRRLVGSCLCLSAGLVDALLQALCTTHAV